MWARLTSGAVPPRKQALTAPATYAGCTTRTATMWGHENRVRENIMVIEEAMHEGFSKEEFNMMLGFLDRVIDNMEKLNK